MACNVSWFPEINHHCPGVPIILHGCQMDLIHDSYALESLKNKRLQPIPYEEAVKVAKEIGACACIYSSSLTGQNVKVSVALCLRTEKW